MELSEITAEKCREILNNKIQLDAEEVLTSIFEETQRGNCFLYYYDYLKDEILMYLRSKGFEVITMGQSSIKKDVPFYKICW